MPRFAASVAMHTTHSSPFETRYIDPFVTTPGAVTLAQWTREQIVTLGKYAFCGIWLDVLMKSPIVTYLPLSNRQRQTKDTYVALQPPERTAGLHYIRVCVNEHDYKQHGCFFSKQKNLGLVRNQTRCRPLLIYNTGIPLEDAAGPAEFLKDLTPIFVDITTAPNILLQRPVNSAAIAKRLSDIQPQGFSLTGYNLRQIQQLTDFTMLILANCATPPATDYRCVQNRLLRPLLSPQHVLVSSDMGQTRRLLMPYPFSFYLRQC